MKARYLLPLLLLLLAFGHAACEGTAVTGTSVTYDLTAAGGKFLGPSGSRLIVDKQPTLTAAGVTITLSQADPDLIPKLAGHRLLSTGFYVESNVPGLVFNPPAMVELRYARGELSAEVRRRALVPSRCEGPYPAYSREDERPPRSWTTLPNGTADPAAIGSYQANTSSPGLFAIFAPESVFGTDGDADTQEAEPEGNVEGESPDGL